jgi:hypothetical protein
MGDATTERRCHTRRMRSVHSRATNVAITSA